MSEFPEYGEIVLLSPRMVFSVVGGWERRKGEYKIDEESWVRLLLLVFTTHSFIDYQSKCKCWQCSSTYAKPAMLCFALEAVFQRKSTISRVSGRQSKTTHRIDSAVILSKVHRASLLSLGHSDKFLKTGTPDCKGRTSKISWGCN